MGRSGKEWYSFLKCGKMLGGGKEWVGVWEDVGKCEKELDPLNYEKNRPLVTTHKLTTFKRRNGYRHTIRLHNNLISITSV